MKENRKKSKRRHTIKIVTYRLRSIALLTIALFLIIATFTLLIVYSLMPERTKELLTQHTIPTNFIFGQLKISKRAKGNLTTSPNAPPELDRKQKKQLKESLSKETLNELPEVLRKELFQLLK